MVSGLYREQERKAVKHHMDLRIKNSQQVPTGKLENKNENSC